MSDAPPPTPPTPPSTPPPGGSTPPPPPGGSTPPPPPGGPTPPPAGGPGYGAATQEMSPPDQRLWATLIHIGGILFGFLPPLIGYLVLKDRGAFIRAHSATALNFQITLLIAYVVGWVLAFVLIGFLILFAAWVAAIVFGIIAAMKANQGQPYVYPIAIKFVS